MFVDTCVVVAGHVNLVNSHQTYTAALVIAEEKEIIFGKVRVNPKK